MYLFNLENGDLEATSKNFAGEWKKHLFPIHPVTCENIESHFIFGVLLSSQCRRYCHDWNIS